MQQLGAKIQRVRFEAADLYYCNHGETNQSIYKLPPALLMTKKKWRTSRIRIIKEVRRIGLKMYQDLRTRRKIIKWLEIVGQDEIDCPIEAATEMLGIEAVQSALQDWALDAGVDIVCAVFG